MTNHNYPTSFLGMDITTPSLSDLLVCIGITLVGAVVLLLGALVIGADNRYDYLKFVPVIFVGVLLSAFGISAYKYPLKGSAIVGAASVIVMILVEYVGV